MNPRLQAEEVRAQLQLVAEARAAGQQALLEAQRAAQESREGREAQRRQAQEARRALGDEAREKEALRRSNEELRAALRRTEGERIRCEGCSGSWGCWGFPGVGCSGWERRGRGRCPAGRCLGSGDAQFGWCKASEGDARDWGGARGGGVELSRMPGTRGWPSWEMVEMVQGLGGQCSGWGGFLGQENSPFGRCLGW